MIEVKTIEELIKIGMAIVGSRSVRKAYLTECRGCCSSPTEDFRRHINDMGLQSVMDLDASYRIFVDSRDFGIPKFKKNGHPDTWENLNTLVVKTYCQPEGFAEKIAHEINSCILGQAVKITEGIPKIAICYQLGQLR